MKSRRAHLDSLTAGARAITRRGWHWIRGDSSNRPGGEAVGCPCSRESSHDLKILIVSTPKTGNTWVKNLLSTIYGLPIVQIGPRFDPAEVDALGPRWVTHQHYTAQPQIIEYAQRNNVEFVTTIRHPGDALVSKFHFVRNFVDRLTFSDIDLSPLMSRDDDAMGEHTAYYAKHGFPISLDISLGWMRTARSHVVRYEDLWRDPVDALTQLTDSLQPVPQDRIERATDLCDIQMLRRFRDDAEGKFFRKGGPGNWRYELPASIIDVFRHQEPYPDLFKALGYTLDPHDPVIDAPRKPRKSMNPFLEHREFENGVEVPLTVVRLYLSLEPGLRAQWFDNVTATSGGSFFAWLNSPADDDPKGSKQEPMITNLAHHVYRTRPDLQRVFPDPFGEDRRRFAGWFIIHAQTEYHLDTVFIESMRSGTEIASRTLSAGIGTVFPLVVSLRRRLRSWARDIRARRSLRR